MKEKIQEMRDHYIVCGGGETGRQILFELIKNHEAVVLIEQDEERIERCQAMGELLYVKGDATDDHNLIEAGITRAAGLIVSLPSDKDTLYITMTARILNKNARIISSMADTALEPKLRKAGANSVVSPNFIGGLRMASELIRPTVVDFLDKMLRSEKGNLRIDQITISANSAGIGKNISECGFKGEYNLLVLGRRKSSDEIEFNPASSLTLEPGMKLIVMGEVENIRRADQDF
jgi:voltage-gated potassium channel